VASRIDGRIMVAYNLDFDRAFLKEEFERNGRAWTETKYIDPLIFARHFHKNQGSKRLEAVAARLGFKLEGAHRAGADAEVTGKVLYAFAPQLPKTLNELLVLQRQWQQQQANEMAAWRNRRETVVESAELGVNIERGNALGPAYLYGDETDPVRAMFVHLPDSGTRR
jgi:DNA polymerase III alpha subunit (gram-positive type)